MVEAIAFQTRARTIDHLGREQIADCPTAISELWKNAYDAYAREVALHIFDGDIPVAAVVDDGHGMGRDEFIEKWLVVGTEAKATDLLVPDQDRNGLPVRTKQGQKGIGRLSCAILGSLLLVISKRRSEPFVASLIDWRLFENPFLLLQDIKIPVVDFHEKYELISLIPDMFDTLMGNVWGDGKDQARDERISVAWHAYDEMEKRQLAISARAEGNRNTAEKTTREIIEQIIIDTTFDERNLARWPVWSGTRETGTALLMSSINFDLKAQLPLETQESAEKQARDRLFKTLCNFTDPFGRSGDTPAGYAGSDFRCSAVAWNGSRSRPIISEDREFDLANLEELEHILEGYVDQNGTFHGKVKAFGRWLEGAIQILPPGGMPARSDTRVGSFHLRVGTFELMPLMTTLPKELQSLFAERAEKYSGFLVFRDGLRVMPYGREDNDFFEIEKRRTQHAGREFWTSRRMFGRIALTRESNPNLRDKAGREGFIDNRAAKAFRDLVTNILKTSARRYFGTDSTLRQDLIPEIKEHNRAERAEEDRKKLRQKKRKEFRKRLADLSPRIEKFLELLSDLSHVLSNQIPGEEGQLLNLRLQLSEYADQHRGFALGEAPKDLGALEEEYHEYRSKYQTAQTLLTGMNDLVARKLEEAKPKAPRDIAYSELSRNASYLQHRIRKWARDAFSLLETEKQRINKIVEDRNRSYHGTMLPLLNDVEHGRLPLSKILDELAREKDRQDRDNAAVFEPYIGALESLGENIDLESIAIYGMEQVSELRAELERLNALAQLGITVEIIGHELESLDTTIARGLRELPKEVQDTEPYRAVKFAHEDLTNRLRFLSPLKLAGDRTKRSITGQEITAYVRKFFGEILDRNGVQLEATSAFENFRIVEQPARLLPVFINLVNNSRYWVCQSKGSGRHILFDVVNSKVVVADDGPGVDAEDLRYLFTLFFTRKIRGGRGVGLYLCRSNLIAGGHTIHYATDGRERILSGANFVIDLKGAEYA